MTPISKSLLNGPQDGRPEILNEDGAVTLLTGRMQARSKFSGGMRRDVLKVYCGFNDGAEDDRFWIVYVGDKPLESQASALGLKDGDTVILFQDVR